MSCIAVLQILLTATLCTSSCSAAPVQATREQQLQQKLQSILDKHSKFWNASFSVGVHNATYSVAAASGLNDYSDPSSKLTPDNQIPMGSTTKMFTAVTLLKLAAAGEIHMDQPIAPLVDRYLANPEPCDAVPDMCKSKCIPHAHCYGKPTFLCKSFTKEQKAACSYCWRYLHCFSKANSQVPSKVTLTQLWDNNNTIEQVTFRQLLSMNSGVKDYYFDQSNWLYDQVTGSTRDVEPLEYLVHMDHTFEFPPGSTLLIPPGKPGAGQTVKRGSYSTNGFSLIGLALAGHFNLSSWADLDQKTLAWGTKLPKDDGTMFPTRGTCLAYPKVAHQYTSPQGAPFEEITNHSCLNSWLGGNIAPRPLDVARFAYTVFGTDELIDEASRKEMLTLHPMTDVFAQYQLAYGLGVEAAWNNGNPGPTPYCGYSIVGHGGLDYGSGAPMNGYIPQLGLGFSLAMTSGLTFGSQVGGMACDRNYDQLAAAYGFASNEIGNALAEFAGVKPTCPANYGYNKPPASSCVDAPSIGTFNGNDTTCAAFVAFAQKDYKISAERLCDTWLNTMTLSAFAQQYAAQNISYVPPKGYDPDTTTVVELCKGTCLAAGGGPCWLRAPHKEWCHPPPAPPPGSRGNCCFGVSSCSSANKLQCPGIAKTKPCDSDQNVCISDCHGTWCPLNRHDTR